MSYITTTDLRTKSSKLVDSLKKGLSVSLIHRSQIIGVIHPTLKKIVPITDSDAFKGFLTKVKPSKTVSKKNREKVYRQHLVKKHGQNLS